MKTAISLLKIFVLILALSITGCKKEQGPKGDTGATGPQGPAGTPTIQNISITIQPFQWIYSSSYQQWYYNYPCSANSQSAVLGYVMSGNGKQVLPYVYTQGNCRYTMATNLFMTSPYIQFQFTNFTSATVAPTSDQYFYLVIIPPALRKPNVNYANYSEVKAAHNLKD